MNKKEQSRQTFDLQASKYDTTFYGKHARKIYPYLLNEIIRCYGEEVLDLGCGTGALMKQVISEDSHRHLTGIDLSSQMIEKAKHQLKNKATLVVEIVRICHFLIKLLILFIVMIHFITIQILKKPLQKYIVF